MLKIITLLIISSSFIFSLGLRKSGNSVIDRDNNLVWQDHKDNVKLELKHDEAVKYCKLLKQDNFTNWRLPSIEEYKKIINNSRKKDDEIMIDKAFYHIIQGDYWTSNRTWMRNFGKYAYFIFIKSGHIYYQNRDYYKNIRCVRDR